MDWEKREISYHAVKEEFSPRQVTRNHSSSSSRGAKQLNLAFEGRQTSTRHLDVGTKSCPIAECRKFFKQRKARLSQYRSVLKYTRLSPLTPVIIMECARPFGTI
jgi:hypothetical protein